MSFAPETETVIKPETLFRAPIGMASPLWGLFAGAAITGATWWWMTRWTRPQNVEALMESVAEAEADVQPQVAALTGPRLVGAEALDEAAPEPLGEAIAELTPEPVVQAMAEITPEPVAEPVAPQIAAQPAPKPKKKAVAPKAE